MQRVRRRHRVDAAKRRAASGPHPQLGGRKVKGVPDGGRAGFTFDQPAGDLGAGFFRRRFADRRENAARRGRVSRARVPGVAQPREGIFHALEVGGVALIVERVPVHLLLSAEVEQARNHRAQYGLGMLPADGLQRTAGVRRVDRFVADIAVVAGAVAPQHGEDFVGAAAAGERHDRALRAPEVPSLHRLGQLGGGATGRRDRPRNRRHGVVSTLRLGVALLGRFEIVQCVEQGQQPRVGRRF